ncbi:Rv3212 family protein [Nocardia jiangsuensis]|uniref:Pyrroloquinoline-quinone binding quinoprotein n=1 Tax=Nocardia jiangsuensis TaxID=1691563 RepID=A0ABV8DPN1_9NOCA
MLEPERQTRADLLTAAGIAVLVLLAALVVWVNSGARQTDSATAATTVAPPPAAGTVPVALRELWQVPDPVSTRVLLSGAVLITGDGGTVTGRDAGTGAELWHYRRDLPLCGLETQFGTVIATYRDERGCSQTTMLAADTGARRTARSSYLDGEIRLTVDGTYTLAAGDRRLEVWRSDLVRTLEYGYVDAPVNVKTQPRHGCELRSAASSASRLAVLERCPGDASPRLTVLDPAPKDNTVPEEFGSRVLTGPGADAPGARVLAVTEDRVLVALPGGPGPDGTVATPRLEVFDGTGNGVTTHELSAPLAESATLTRIGSAALLFTGNSVIALNVSSFDPLWVATEAIGSPAIMAGRLLLPAPGAVLVLDPITGEVLGRIPVDRGASTGPVALAVSGSTVLELRDGRVHALG